MRASKLENRSHQLSCRQASGWGRTSNPFRTCLACAANVSSKYRSQKQTSPTERMSTPILQLRGISKTSADPWRSCFLGPTAFRRGVAFADSTLGVKLRPIEYRQIIPPTPEQTWALIKAARQIGGVGYPIAYLGAFCGVRRSEVLGLRFVDIRWFDNEIRIQHAISKRHSQDGIHKWEWYLGPPKSRKSLRGISATESVMRLLGDLRSGNADSGFVFPGDCHGFTDPDKFETDIWRPIVDRAELTGTRFHDLRHFFASQLIANGETAAYVRDQMGHSSIHVTFDTCGHLFPGRGKEASARFEKSMDAARRKSEAAVSNPLAIAGDEMRKPDTSN
jgi:integrase